MPDCKVLVTGARGYIASQIVPTLKERYDVRLLDVDLPDAEAGSDDVVAADLSNPDLEGYARYFDGMDTVVHLAHGWRRGFMLDDFHQEKVNVEMAYNTYRASYEAGVRRVVVASSNHAADWYEHALIHERKMEVLGPYELPLSDNFYGWAKATYEHMGFLFASGAFGRKLEVVLIRIGAPRELRVSDYVNDPRMYKRDLGAYISQRDMCQLFTKSIETPNIENVHGIPWLVVYGTSDNTRGFWSLTNARQVLGYAPEDDSEVKYDEDICGFLTGGPGAGVGRVGG